MLIEDWPITKVRPYPNNPRVLRNAAEKVAESIKAFGWRQPIVVDAEGVIIAGHSRHAAAQLLKLKKVPVHVAKDLTPDQVRALRVADNKTATFSEWDDAKLADELAEIMAGLGAVTVTGFSQAEFDAIEMKARAEIDRIAQMSRVTVPQAAPASDDDDDFDLGDDAPAETTGGDLPAASAGGTVASSPPDLVPFNALMTVDARQVVYDAVAKAKRQHALETTADALTVIARSYLDA
jgi:site-specific DNA-methyltransferase (adenine-specific)